MGDKKSLKKDNQKKFPLQIPYHIKVSLQEYYKNFYKWQIPDFSANCPICGCANCATYHGYYTRTAICPGTGYYIRDLPVLRFICCQKGDAPICDHKTFSLLPFMLVPYRQLSLQFMVLAIWIKVSRHLTLTSALDVIEHEFNDLDEIANFINISTVTSWQNMILAAFRLIKSTDIDLLSNFRNEQIQGDEGLLLFFETIIHYDFTINHHPVRGPDAFAWEFYQKSGGPDKCPVFLFGLASQQKI